MNNDNKDRMDRVIKYIEENSNQKLNLDILAAVSNLSKYHFSRIFTSLVGVTPVAYVNRELRQATLWAGKGIIDIEINSILKEDYVKQ